MQLLQLNINKYYAIKKLAEFFQNTSISTITFDYTGIGKSLHGKSLHFVPENFKALKIGHFLFFTEKFKDSIWNVLPEDVNS